MRCGLREVQLGATLHGDRHAKYATSFLEHEVHILRRYFLGGYDEVAFVFTVFIVYHNEELAFTEVGNRFFDCI